MGYYLGEAWALITLSLYRWRCGLSDIWFTEQRAHCLKNVPIVEVRWCYKIWVQKQDLSFSELSVSDSPLGSLGNKGHYAKVCSLSPALGGYLASDKFLHPWLNKSIMTVVVGPFSNQLASLQLASESGFEMMQRFLFFFFFLEISY